MADEPKPAEEPIVSEDVSDTADASRRFGDRPSEADAIPDAEVIVEREVPYSPPPRPDPEPQAARAAMVTEAAPPRRSGAFLGFLLGGAISAAGGFALARYLPDLLPTTDTSELTAKLEQQAATLTELRTQVEALGARETPDLGSEFARIRGELDARLAALPAAPDASALAAEARSAAEAAIAGLTTRLADLEKRPVAAAVTGGAAGSSTAGLADNGSDGGAAAGAVAALAGEVEALKASLAGDVEALKADLEAQRGDTSGATEELKAMAAATEAQLAAAMAEAEKLKADAEATGRAALARAALARIKASLDGGEPFSSAVAELTETGHEVPAVLADAAATGIASLTALQRSYPEAARTALDTALRADVGESWTDRATAFLRTQTGARSLTPLDGSDPDAILSRAEAALDAGQLTTTLTELSALPDAAKAPLADWIATADRREAATAAIATLSTALDAE